MALDEIRGGVMERSDGDVRYIDYTPETVRSLLPDTDGVVVAEAHITNAAGHTLNIVVGVSAQELKVARATTAEAIEAAKKSLPRYVAEGQAPAARLTESREVRHWLRLPRKGTR
jgi:hypothetical protein